MVKKHKLDEDRQCSRFLIYFIGFICERVNERTNERWHLAVAIQFLTNNNQLMAFSPVLNSLFYSCLFVVVVVVAGWLAGNGRIFFALDVH